MEWRIIDDGRYPGRVFYRDEDKKRRITVCLENPRYYDERGELSHEGLKWIVYRDSNGFREGEFATREEALAFAEAKG